MNTKQIITIILIGLASIIASFFLGRCTYKCPEPDETIASKSDTIYVNSVDTIKVKDIVYLDRIVLDTIHVTDTILLREQLTYEDSLATIWISGVQPSLDSVEYRIPHDSVFINTEITKTIVERKHWRQFIGVGFSAGVMAGYNPIDRTAAIVAPGVGITVTYGFGYTW